MTELLLVMAQLALVASDRQLHRMLLMAPLPGPTLMARLPVPVSPPLSLHPLQLNVLLPASLVPPTLLLPSSYIRALRHGPVALTVRLELAMVNMCRLRPPPLLKLPWSTARKPALLEEMTRLKL